MAEQNIKSRLQLKIDTPENWAKASKAQSPFIPKKGEPIVYQDGKISQLKIGNGIDIPENLPYVEEHRVESVNGKIGAVQLTAEDVDAATEAYVDETVAQKSQVQMVKDGAAELVSTLKIEKLTQAEYDQKDTDGTLDEHTIYLTPDEDISGIVANALIEAKAYTDSEISNLINGAPTTLDTLGEIATAMAENADVVQALNEALEQKSQVQIVTWEADD